MANTYLNRTPSSASNRKTWTWSGWVKRSSVSGSDYPRLFCASTSSSDRVEFYFRPDDKLQAEIVIGNTGRNLITEKVFRDLNAWYHIVLAVDTTLSTSSDRIKIFINGERVTNIVSGETMPNQNDDTAVNNNVEHRIGNSVIYNTRYHNGLMSHIHLIDGTAYDASYFGETDSTTGEWKIKTSPSVTYGTNGFFILKDGNSVTDQSGNSNNFTVSGGTLTNTEDNPSNVFCTLNPLQIADTGMSVTYSFGNTKYAGDSSAWQRVYGTIGANTGKYYYEFKCLNSSGAGDALRIGWDSIDSINSGTDNYYSGLTLDRDGKLRGGEDGYNNYDPNAVQMTAAYSGGNFSFTTGDILGMAIDIDNNTFSVYKNGNLEINAYSYASASNCSLLKSKGHFIAPSANWFSSSGNGNRSCFNFGNGYFETTAISSEGTNASGIGKFEYDVPTGYTAFSTKGLNE